MENIENLLTNIDKTVTTICVFFGFIMILLLGVLFTYLFSELDKCERRNRQKMKDEIVKEIKEESK